MPEKTRKGGSNRVLTSLIKRHFVPSSNGVPRARRGGRKNSRDRGWKLTQHASYSRQDRAVKTATGDTAEEVGEPFARQAEAEKRGERVDEVRAPQELDLGSVPDL
jgi:hypothetical protein